MTAWTGYDEPTVPGWNVTVAVSPDLGAYAAGDIDASQVRCLMCQAAPCECEGRFPFGSTAYLARLNEIHGRRKP